MENDDKKETIEQFERTQRYCECTHDQKESPVSDIGHIVRSHTVWLFGCLFVCFV